MGLSKTGGWVVHNPDEGNTAGCGVDLYLYDLTPEEANVKSKKSIKSMPQT